MSVTNVVNIINVLRQPSLHLRGVGNIYVYDDSITVGNSSVTARCHIDGIEGDKVIKCYFRKKQNTAIIYASGFYPDALDIYSINGDVTSIDVVVMEWHEGETLDKYILSDTCDFNLLSRNFDAMALELIEAEYAHGDIKPENIVIAADGSMHLVDLDATWNEDVAECSAEEYGTATFNTPLRPIIRRDKHIDDHAIAIISVILATLRADSSLLEEFTKYGTLQLYVEDNNELLDTIAEILFKAGDVSHHNIVSTIKNFGGKIYNIEQLIRRAVSSAQMLDADMDAINSMKRLYREASMRREGVRELEKQANTSSVDWSFEDDERLVVWTLEGCDATTIAQRLNRTTKELEMRLAELGIPTERLKDIDLRREMELRGKRLAHH